MCVLTRLPHKIFNLNSNLPARPVQTLGHHNMSMRYSCWQHFLTCFKCLSGTDSSETTAVTPKWHGIGVKIHLFLSSRVLRVAKELQDKKQCVFYQHPLQSPKMMRKTTCTLSVALHVVLKSEQAMIRSALRFFFCTALQPLAELPNWGIQVNAMSFQSHGLRFTEFGP